MSEEKLNPCPWCGSEPTLNECMGEYWISCECGIETGFVAITKLRETWNRPLAALDAMRLQLAAEAADAIAKVTAEKDDEIKAYRERADSATERNRQLLARCAELEVHERNTHDTIGRILGRDDALHVVAQRVVDQNATLRAEVERLKVEREAMISDWRVEVGGKVATIIDLEDKVSVLSARVPVVCVTCAGSGKVPEHQAVLRGNVNYVRCDDCEGTGATWREGG